MRNRLHLRLMIHVRTMREANNANRLTVPMKRKRDRFLSSPVFDYIQFLLIQITDVSSLNNESNMETSASQCTANDLSVHEPRIQLPSAGT
jgi:hypothetical protein